MATKSNHRNWQDVEIAIATIAIVGTLGLWNLFATPSPKLKSQANPAPPVKVPPLDPSTPTPMPYIKIVFATKIAPQPVTFVQPQTTQKQRHKKNNNNDGGGGGGTITTTTTS
jgi:hypothetical protein